MDRLFITLKMDLTQDDLGAGWYVQVVADGQQVIPSTAIPMDSAQEIAEAFQTALRDGDEELPQVAIPQLAKSASLMMRSALEDQLRFAEDQAARIGPLRRKLAQLPPADKESMIR